MSTRTISIRVGTRILRSCGALLMVGAVVLLAGASCTSATVDTSTRTSGGGNIPGGGGAGNGGGGNAGNAGCGILCVTSGGGSGGNTTVQIDSKKCGDGVLDKDLGEQCDDGNKDNGDGCNKICQIEANFKCDTPGQLCVDQRKCGNGVLTSDETCDDGNTVSGDGCPGDCKSPVEAGWQCRVPGKPCVPLCGDGVLKGSETCDDGNAVSGDGCSSTCQKEPGADCPTPGQPCTKSVCGNAVVETGELCDAGKDKNGLFYGDGKGCSKTCTKEPSCRDSAGHNQACTTSCGDGNLDPGEDCDDANQVSGDGCSKDCKFESGFVCTVQTLPDSTTCQSGSGQCLELPIIYRDFQPENTASGGHPDFYWLGTKASGAAPTTICVPNSGGPAKGNDSTARCWDIPDPNLLNGKPIYNAKRANNQCACQFSDWNIGNSGRIPGNYTQAANDSPLSDGAGGYRGGAAGTPVSVTNPSGTVAGTLTGYTASTPGGPIFKGMVPIVKDANSFKQWFTDDSTVNKTFVSVLEMTSIGANLYQYASKTHLSGPDNGFYPLDILNPTQATLCDLWPYWNHGNGTPIWATCTGDQYYFPPRVIQSDCPNQNPLSNGCWVTATPGVKHDNYFSDEARYYFAYDGTAGLTLQFFGDDDLFVFINGKLVLDLGGVHQQLPGKVVVAGESGATQANITEGGCLDAAGNITGVTAGSAACSPTNSTPPAAVTPDDFRVRTMDLGLKTGSTYEIAVFGADRHPPESNFQLTLSGFTVKQSVCIPHCGDGIVSGGEECDCGDGTVPVPANCLGANNDTLYGGCTTACKFGPFCGDSVTQGPQEQCDLGKKNGSDLTKTGCTFGCTTPHYCGDGILDTDLKEDCDLGQLNNVKLDASGNPASNQNDPNALVHCDDKCKIPIIFQ